MERLSRHEVSLAIAKQIARRGTCKRLQVGAIITLDGRIISSGYNGPLEDEAQCEWTCNAMNPCTKSVHAEANAIYAAAKYGIALKGASLYSTHSPCEHCVEAIVQSGIKHLYFIEQFRETSHLKRLKIAGINMIQFKLSPEGNIIDELIWTF